VYINFYLNF